MSTPLQDHSYSRLASPSFISFKKKKQPTNKNLQVKKRKILFFQFSHETCTISECGSQIFTLEKPSTKLRFARVGTSTSAV